MKPFKVSQCVKEENCILVFQKTKDWFYVDFMQANTFSGKKRLYTLIKHLSADVPFVGGRDLRTIGLRFKIDDVFYDTTDYLFKREVVNG